MHHSQRCSSPSRPQQLGSRPPCDIGLRDRGLGCHGQDAVIHKEDIRAGAHCRAIFALYTCREPRSWENVEAVPGEVGLGGIRWTCNNRSDACLVPMCRCCVRLRYQYIQQQCLHNDPLEALHSQDACHLRVGGMIPHFWGTELQGCGMRWVLQYPF